MFLALANFETTNCTMVTSGDFVCEYYYGIGYQWPENGGKRKNAKVFKIVYRLGYISHERLLNMYLWRIPKKILEFHFLFVCVPGIRHKRLSISSF